MSQPAIGPVYVVTPGGTRAAGGIGRMIDYFTRSWAVEDAPITVVDSYGLSGQRWMPAAFAVALARLAKDAALGRIGVLHVHMSERASVVRKGLVVHLGHAFGIPVVLHLHGADFADYCRGLKPRGRKLVKAMMGRCGAVVALGGYWRDFVVDDLEVPAERVTVLHNAVPGPADMPVRDANRPCRILFLGVLGERKGVPVLLNALAHPGLRDRPWVGTLAGNGAVDEARAQAAALGIGSRLCFPGWVDEAGARRLLAEHDVLVLPSRNEGLPMSILEAMAWGLPVVSTPVGAIADAVEHGQTGLLVPVGDHIALAEALGRLAADPELRRQMGQAARDSWAGNFDITGYNSRLESLYRRVRQPPAQTEPQEEFAR